MSVGTSSRALAAGSALLALLAFFPNRIARSAEVASAPAPSLDNAVSVMAIGDLHGFLDGLGALAGSVSPGMNAQALRDQAGAILGDPELSGIPAGAGIAAVSLPGHSPIVFLEAAQEKSDTYIQQLAVYGILGRWKDSALIMARVPADLDAGEALYSEVNDQYLKEPGAAEARVLLFMGPIMDQYGPMIDTLLGAIPQMTASARMMSPQASRDPGAAERAGRLAEMEFRVLLQMARDADRVEARFLPSAQGLRVDLSATPVAGGALEALIQAPAPGSADLLALLPAGGVVRAESDMNGEALAGYVKSVVGAIRAQMAAMDEQTQSMVDLMVSSIQNYSVFAAQLDLSPEGPMSAAMVYQVTDAAGVETLFQTIEEAYANSGMADMALGLGAPMEASFERNAREYKGVAIHRFAMKMDLSRLPEQQAAMMEKMMAGFAYEVAILQDKGLVVLSMGQAKIESLIDEARAETHSPAAPLKAAADFPDGAQAYADFHVGGFFRWMGSLMAGMTGMPAGANDPFTALDDALAGAEPVTTALWCGNGRAQGSLLVPASVIAGFRQGAMASMGPSSALMAPPPPGF